MARRLARYSPARVRLEPIAGDVVNDAVAVRLRDSDFMFLAADSMQARLVFNALVHQYLIPGIQAGSKVPVDRATGDVGVVFSACRPVLPDSGCLWCNGLITRDGLQEEAIATAERRAWRYVEDEMIPAASVITLNAVAASEAANDFLFWLVGLRQGAARRGYTRHIPRTRSLRFEDPRADPACTECGSSAESRFGRGDGTALPTRSPSNGSKAQRPRAPRSSTMIMTMLSALSRIRIWLVGTT